ncbi:MAG: GntR family transcriptional regulator [Thiomonas sp.]
MEVVRRSDMPIAPITFQAQHRSIQISIPQTSPSLYEQVYSSILEAICGGILRPGDRLNQDELAARLNVSRQPVTQALTVLRSQDFVQDSGRRGLLVAPIRRAFFESLYELRESLDPMAAKLAARHSDKLSRERADALMERGHAALRDGRIAELTSADMSFHMWIYESAGNPLLLETLRLYWNHLRRAMVTVLEPSTVRDRVWDEHARILDAVLSGDQQEAERLSLLHIQQAAQRVVGNLPST